MVDQHPNGEIHGFAPQEKLPVVPTPTVLLAPPTMKSESVSQDLLRRSTAFYDAIQGKNYVVKFLRPENDNGATHSLFVPGQELERVRPDTTITVPDVTFGPTRYSIMWPRDAFQVFDDLVFIPTFMHEKNALAILRKLGATNPTVLIDPEIGEGGFNVRAGKVMVFGKSVERNEHIDLLRDRGYKIYFTPNEITEDHPELFARIGRDQHIDLEFNIAEAKNGKFYSLVSKDYYDLFAADVDRIISDLGAALHIVSSPAEIQRRSINFITLPDGRVVIPDKCPETQSFLEDGLGKENVIAVEVNPEEDYGKEDGLRCKSSVI